MKSSIPLCWILMTIHLIPAASSSDIYGKLYAINCKINTSSIYPVQMKTTPSLLSCTHACVRCEMCTAFNYCTWTKTKDTGVCEMFGLDDFFMKNEDSKYIIPNNDCSLYTMLEEPFQKVDVVSFTTFTTV